MVALAVNSAKTKCFWLMDVLRLTDVTEGSDYRCITSFDNFHTFLMSQPSRVRRFGDLQFKFLLDYLRYSALFRRALSGSRTHAIHGVSCLDTISGNGSAQISMWY